MDRERSGFRSDCSSRVTSVQARRVGEDHAYECGVYLYLQSGKNERLLCFPLIGLLSSRQLDYPAGVLPVDFVDKDIDRLQEGFFSSAEYNSMNSVAKGAYSVYDSETMHGLPLGIQVVGRRLEEEKVLEGMKVIEAALKSQGTVFVGKAKV